VLGLERVYCRGGRRLRYSSHSGIPWPVMNLCFICATHHLEQQARFFLDFSEWGAWLFGFFVDLNLQTAH
jgi:hypothetical protein